MPTDLASHVADDAMCTLEHLIHPGCQLPLQAQMTASQIKCTPVLEPGILALTCPECRVYHIFQGFLDLTIFKAGRSLLVGVDLTPEKQGYAYWTNTTGCPEIRLTSSSVEAVRSLVATGQAVTILSDVLYRPWTLDGRRVEKFKPKEAIPTMDVGIAWKKDTAQSPAVKALCEAFTRSLCRA